MNEIIALAPSLEQLKEILNMIDWDLKKVGCGWYRIYNHKNLPTVFEIHKDSDELKDGYPNIKVFGSSYCGAININLKHVKLTYFENEQSPFVSISPKVGDPNKIFISFYNHDFKEKK